MAKRQTSAVETSAALTVTDAIACNYFNGLPLLLFLLAAVPMTYAAAADGLPTDGLTAPLVDFRISNYSTPPSPSDSIYWSAPMTLWNISNRFGVGTDNNDCRQKDATAARTKTSPPTGYLQFRYTVPAAGYFYYRAEVNAPDSLANSMWVQFDNSTKPLEWGAVQSTTWAPDNVRVPHIGTDREDRCFPQASGSHMVRFYAREAGTVISSFAVYAAPQLTVVRTAGCEPSCTARENTIRFTFQYFCGEVMNHPGLVKLNGQPCDRLEQTSVFGEFSCKVSDEVVSAASHTAERILRLSLDVPNPDPATAAQRPYIQVPTDVVFAVDPPTQFPAYGYALIAIAAVLAVAAAVYAIVIRPWLRNRFAPRTAGSGVGICFVAMPPTCASPAVHRDFCARARRAVTANSCHVFKRIGSSALAVVAARPSDAVRFAVELQAASEAKSERYVELEKEHAAAVLQEKNRKANKKSSKKKAPVAVTTSKNDAEDEDTAASRAASVRPLIAVHCGNVTVTFDRETDEYDYTGAAVDEGAVLVDLAHPGQLLLSHPVVAALETNGIAGARGETLDLETALIPYAVRILNPNDQPASCEAADGNESADDDADEDIGGPQRADDKDSDRRLSKDPSSSSLAETADDASAAGTQVYTLRAGAFTHVDFTFDDSESSGNSGGLGVAAQLRQAHGGLATAKGTVLLVDPGVDLASHRSAVIYEQVIAQIAAIVEKRGGTLQAVHNSLLVFTFNIRSPVVAHRRKAALAATEIQSARFGSHIQPAGALTSGSVTFGMTEGEHGVVAGPALDAALRLLYQLKTVTQRTAAAGRRPNKLRADSVAATVTSDRPQHLHHQHQLQQVTSEHDGDSFSSEDTDSSSHYSGSGSHRTSTSRLSSHRSDGSGGLLQVRYRSRQIRFVCDGPAYVDLCDAFDMVVLHARTAAEIEERRHRAERRQHSSAATANKHANAPRAQAPLEPKDVVALAGIVGVKVMSDAEEWQYDLANIEAGSPYAGVSSAFLAAARGDADGEAIAERVLARFRETQPPPVLRMPLHLLQDFVHYRQRRLDNTAASSKARIDVSNRHLASVSPPNNAGDAISLAADSVTSLPFVVQDRPETSAPATVSPPRNNNGK